MSEPASAQPEKVFSPPVPASSSPASSAVLKAVRKPRRLKPTQQAFIQHYTSIDSPTFANGRQSYKRSHPTCQSDNAAAVGAVNTLNSPKVQAAMEDMGWTKERLEREMEWNVQTCKEKGRFGDHREGVKVLAQLRGDWKERSEVDAHVTQEAQDTLRRAVAEAIRLPNTLGGEPTGIVPPSAS